MPSPIFSRPPSAAAHAPELSAADRNVLKKFPPTQRYSTAVLEAQGVPKATLDTLRESGFISRDGHWHLTVSGRRERAALLAAEDNARDRWVGTAHQEHASFEDWMASLTCELGQACSAPTWRPYYDADLTPMEAILRSGQGGRA